MSLNFNSTNGYHNRVLTNQKQNLSHTGLVYRLFRAFLDFADLKRKKNSLIRLLVFYPTTSISLFTKFTYPVLVSQRVFL